MKLLLEEDRCTGCQRQNLFFAELNPVVARVKSCKVVKSCFKCCKS